MESEPVHVEADGITYLAAGRYYEGFNNLISHDLKVADPEAIQYAAKRMALLIPKDSILVPIPGHHGKANETMRLAMAIADYSHTPVANILVGRERESNYLMKKQGTPLSVEDMGFHQILPLPKGKTPILIDGVVDTGTTAKAAVKALGGGIVVSFAMSDTLLEQKESYIMHR